jgi:hypothetical protein
VPHHQFGLHRAQGFIEHALAVFFYKWLDRRLNVNNRTLCGKNDGASTR